MTRERFHELIWDYLYDLLETAGPDSKAEFERLLRSDPECAAVLEKAKVQRRLLATAAKQAAPREFKPPQTTVEPRPAPAAAAQRERSWRGVLAASLLALVGLGGVAATASQVSVRREISRHEQAAAQLRAETREVTEKFAQLEREVNVADLALREIGLRQTQLATQLRTQARNSEIYLTVARPAIYEAGAPYRMLVHTRNLDHEPIPAAVEVRVFSPQQPAVPLLTNQVRATPNPDTPGAYEVSLPPDLNPQQHPELQIEVVAKADSGPAARLTERLQLFSSFHVAQLSTDKPMYRPGETVFFRSLTLERFSLKPAAEVQWLRYTITDPLGGTIFEELRRSDLIDSSSQQPLLGFGQQPVYAIGCGSFHLPADAPGGEYTLTVREEKNRFAPERRRFVVNAYVAPRLRKELEWNRSTYGLGDEAVAACKVAAAEGGRPLAKQPVEAVLNVDGETYAADGTPSAEPMRLETDAQGRVNVRFRLPRQADKGAASLSVRFTDGANQETLVRPVPLVLNKLFLSFFPEGGDLVAGVPNRVYFHARTTLDRPAEFKGQLVDEAGQPIADLATFADGENPGGNQGVGAFTFTPELGRKYQVRVENPAGAAAAFTMPEVLSEGVVLYVPEGVGPAGSPVNVLIRNVGPARHLLVGMYCRGQTLDQHAIRVDANATAPLTLRAPATVGGVYRVTVFEEKQSQDRRLLSPLAERLIFRSTAQRLTAKLSTQRGQYMPGEKVALRLETQDEKGEAIPSMAMLAVTDKNIITLADDKTARMMPTHFLLTSEVRKPEDLEHTDFLLTDHPSAALVLDLLLGTQGWRRFAEQNPEQFRQKDAEAATELLARQGQNLEPAMQTNYEEVAQRMEAQFALELAVARKPLDQERQTALQRLESARFDLESFQQSAAWGLFKNREHLLRRAEAEIESARKRLAEVWAQTLPLGSGLMILVVGLGALLWFNPASLLLRWGIGAAIVATASGFLLYALLPSYSKQQFSSVGATLGGEARLNMEMAPAPAMQGPAGNADNALERGAAIPPPAPGGGEAFNAAPTREEHAPLADLAVPMTGAPAPPALAAPRDGTNLHLERPAGFDPAKAGDVRRHFAKPEPAKAPEPNSDIRPQVPSMGAGRIAADAKIPNPAAISVQPKGAAPTARNALGGRELDDKSREKLEGKDELGRLAIEPIRIREYAHQRSGSVATSRTDFAETLLWQPAVVLSQGTATASFDLCDSITTFEAIAYVNTADGRLAAARLNIESKLPFNVEPKLPTEITASDRLEVPVAVTNALDAEQEVAVGLVHLRGLAVTGAAEQKLKVDAHSRGSARFKLEALVTEGDAELTVLGRGGSGLNDASTRRIRVVPDGFPIENSSSGELTDVYSAAVELPASWIKGTLRLQATAYPSTLATLQQGLEGLLREPHGCFEQTSSSSYPNALILNYLNQTRQTEPALERRARDLLDRGYEKLVAFECIDPRDQRRGYEWFGGRAAPHEALTAYGLLQFTDMARLRPVDAAMLERTRRYLLDQRDGRGGFARNPRGLDNFGRAPENVTNAYIIWALTESGVAEGLDAELVALETEAETSKDPYLLALAANSFLNVQQPAKAAARLQALVAAQQPDGSLMAGQTSITGSGGRDLKIETTALTLLAWLKAEPTPEFQPAINKAIQWLTAQRGGQGAFGGTQATVLALKALVRHAERHQDEQEDGDLVLWANGRQLATAPFKAGSADPIVLAVENADEVLSAGTNRVRLMLTGKGRLPCTLAWSYRTIKPEAAEQCAVRLTTQLAKTKLTEGDSVRLKVKVKNVSGVGQGMAVAIIGLPAGLTLPEDFKQLKEHARLRDEDTKPGLIAAWETRNRELILYWRDLAPDQEIEVPVDLIARVPGQYRGPASRAYLYYNGDAKHWVDPLAVTISAR